MNSEIKINAIGIVRSTIQDRCHAPKQGYEGAPDAWIEIDPKYSDCLDGMETGSYLVLLTWFHQADRSYQKVHPRGNTDIPKRGVFSTRSPDRPNPIGLHPVKVLEIDGTRLHVEPLEALDGTPIIDIKSELKR